MKRNLITKKELDYVKKYLPAMGPFTMRTDGGAWVEKIRRHIAEMTVEEDGNTGVYFYFIIDADTTIDYLKRRAAVNGIEWRREIEE